MAKYEDIELPMGLKAVPSKEFTAQCWGGPEHGNLISSTQRSWTYMQITRMFLDDDPRMVTENIMAGKYVYDHHPNGGQPMWRWEGPGADGDTIERIRKL